jgi:trehalose/maltose transport system substrate-binding protein
MARTERGAAAVRALARALLCALLAGLPALPAAADDGVELTISCGRFAAETDRCRSAAADWAEATGNRVRVRVLSAPADNAARLALYRELLEVGGARLDVLEIDVVWTGLLAPHLIDLAPHLDGVAAALMPTLVANAKADGRLLALP